MLVIVGTSCAQRQTGQADGLTLPVQRINSIYFAHLGPHLESVRSVLAVDSQASHASHFTSRSFSQSRLRRNELS